MTAAENRIAHLRAIVDREAQDLNGSEKQRLRAAYQSIASAAGVNEEYVYQLYKGFKKKMGDDFAARIERAYAAGRERGWIDLPPTVQSAQEPAPTYSPIRPPTTDEAVERLAEILLALDDAGREMASTALSNLARNPRHASKLAKTLDTLLEIHGREPEPEPPTPSRAGTAAPAENKPRERARLTVKEGGGKKMQMALPFRAVKDPWDTSQATANERAWYLRVKAAPKARS